MTPEFGSPRTAIVTGGARRIGCAISRALAADGWHVLIHYHSSAAEALGLAEELGATIVQADLARADAADRIIAALGGLPPPALLVNSAAGFDLDLFDDFTAEQWDRHMAVNARAPALLTQAFAKAVPDGHNALVVNLLDAKLAQPNPDFFTYTVAKAAFAAVSELSARVLAARNVRVCAIAPSVTLVSGPQTRDNFDEVHRLNALGRGVTVEQIVDALRFIVTTPTITGQTITLDAGQRFLGLQRDVQFL
ncbi:SDR family oxidoreductase [Sphingomonas sp. ID1715]|nr:SDR family oxidoreductase [Sphingomonas sp. ID1715]NNM76968.1 SDR family oxidoreductase [Sphingomonas sp. ID1715]